MDVIKMHRILIQVLVSVILVNLSQSESISLNPDFDERFFSTLTNFTRPKRQLFREDIPHHRPLSGNHYAINNGFPHPGRWADGQRNPYKLTGQVSRPHQHYIDMLDANRHGRYYGGGGGGYSGGYSGGYGHGPSHYKGGHQNYHHPHGFNNDIVQGAGVSDYSGPSGPSGPSGYDGHNPHQQHHQGPGQNYQDESYYDGPPQSKEPNYDYPASGGGGKGSKEQLAFDINIRTPDHHIDVGVHEPQSKPNPSYGPPKLPNYPPPTSHVQFTSGLQEPKAIVHYHPVQYGNILNIPEREEPQSYGPPPTPQQSLGYGPPNHLSGKPIGPGHRGPEGGFIPSKGYPGDHSYEHGSVEGQPQQKPTPEHHHHHRQPRPYRFDPFKIFSRPNPPKAIEHDVPVAIPILAQFHTAKPIKFSKHKNPIEIYFGHHHSPPSYGPGKRRPFIPPFGNRPSKSWLRDHGL